jgi:hypothetical protein
VEQEEIILENEWANDLWPIVEIRPSKVAHKTWVFIGLRFVAKSLESKLNKMGYKVFDPQINSLEKRRNKLFDPQIINNKQNFVSLGPIPFNSG